ncbi:MAG: UDP-N-acetylglucosamine 2-epimerase (hydrolyzing) [Chloroflexi bacterium HGW-Chloroflexi-3]|nr:MAG: UDP-N-acetylglucosamine 2-epimerase (hydrolyzing) [Chloroflexi bacterium HGW-Chloroflexi-3]
MKKILFISGTRADFGKLKPLIRAVQESPEFDYVIFATGMHMLSKYGSTFIEIQKSNFHNIFPYINQDGHINSHMDIVLANTVMGLAHFIRENPVDMIVVHGDRVEPLAGAIVGAFNNILVSHIEGGEVSGTLDELIRHAVSKLSHLHFVANNEAKQRLIQMGENPNSVFIIGSPDIDIMLSDELPSLEEVRNYYGIPFTDYCIFSYHPITTELHKLKKNFLEVTDALIESNCNFVVLYPNSDQGTEIIINRIDSLRQNPKFRIIPSMRFEYYLTLLKNAQIIVGNSSAGVREAPVYGVPTINIGSRQNNRYNYQSIINVPEDKDTILNAIKNYPKSSPSSFYFGKGTSAKMFIEILSNSKIWENNPQKQFQDFKFT